MIDQYGIERDENEPLQCIDCGTTEDVSMQWPGYGQRLFPRCDRCAEARVERERGNIERNLGPRPADFDELDAGEAWEAEPW